MTCRFLPGLLLLGFLFTSCAAWRPKPDALTTIPPPTPTDALADTLLADRLLWRRWFADPVLAALIDTTLARNYDRRIALAHLRQAQAELLRSKAALAPEVQALVAGGAERFGDYTMNGVGNFDLNLSENVPDDREVPNPVTDVFVGLRASWEIDLWQRLRYQREGAAYRVLASQDGLQWLNTNLVASVAGAYYTLLALDAERTVVDTNLALQQRALDLVLAQKEAGRATELAVQQFRAQIFENQALAVQLRQRVVETENLLRLLMGRYEGPIPRGAPIDAQPLPESLRSGPPSAWLLRRPDVRQAERELAATRADLASARAALLPALTLTPYAGLNAFTPGRLFRPESAALGLLGGLAGPVINRRELNARRDAALGRQEAAWNMYQQKMIAAYLEAQGYIAQQRNLNEGYRFKQQETDALLRAVGVANDLYASGYATYLEVITTQRNALKASIERIELRRLQWTNAVDLYRALGGN